jgi:hypothetical protein
MNRDEISKRVGITLTGSQRTALSAALENLAQAAQGEPNHKRRLPKLWPMPRRNPTRDYRKQYMGFHQAVR